MQRLHPIFPISALVILFSASAGTAQTSATTCYASADAGVLGLQLPAFRLFQTVNGAGEHVRFIETDPGDGVGLLYGGKLGWTCYERSTLNGLRIEARGFYSNRDDRRQQLLPPGAVFNLLDQSASVQFLDAATVDYRREVTVINGDMLLKWDMATSNSLIVSPYCGFGILDINQSFDVNAVDAVGGQRMTLTEELRGSYYGGVAGVEVLSRIMPTTILSVDAGVALYEFSADRRAHQTSLLPTESFSLTESTGDAAFAANLRLELSQELRWCQLVVFGSALYLDSVPAVEYGRILNAATVVEPSRLTVSDAWGFTGGVSIRIPF